MKAITICQPYASLILIGKKKVENRTWWTGHRGPLLIHAGKSKKHLGEAALPEGSPLEFGAIIARCKLLDVVSIEVVKRGAYDLRHPWLREHPHTLGPFCWILGDVDPIVPIPCNGKLGLWNRQGITCNLCSGSGLHPDGFECHWCRGSGELIWSDTNTHTAVAE